MAASFMFFTAGCSVFSSYPKEVEPGLRRLKNGNFDAAAEWFNKAPSKKDRSLELVEAGRVSQMAGDRKTSRKHFEEVIRRFEFREMEADVTAEKAGEQIGAILVNDNTIDYRVRGYEKVMVYHHQAMNYLFDGDLDGAAVEIRRAVMAQEMELKRYEDELEEAEEVKEDAEEGTEESAVSAVKDRYQAMEKLAESVKSQFQNPYTFYLSAVVEELDDAHDNALIDYRKAQEVVPENSFVKKDVHRLEKNRPLDVAGREVVLFVEQGFVEQKKEVSIPIPTSKGLLKVAFPLYESSGEPARNFELFSGTGRKLGHTEALANITGLAIKSLKDDAFTMVVRHVARIISKAALQNQLDQNSEWGSLISSVWNLISENADLRAWYTLPGAALLYRGRIPLETDKLVLKRAAKQLSLVLPEKGELIIIKVIDVGDQLRADVISY